VAVAPAPRELRASLSIDPRQRVVSSAVCPRCDRCRLRPRPEFRRPERPPLPATSGRPPERLRLGDLRCPQQPWRGTWCPCPHRWLLILSPSTAAIPHRRISALALFCSILASEGIQLRDGAVLGSWPPTVSTRSGLLVVAAVLLGPPPLAVGRLQVACELARHRALVGAFGSSAWRR
jgi:hypothetical protein